MAATGGAQPQRSRPLPQLTTVVLAGVVTVACLVAQWDVDGNRRVDLRAYWRAVLSGTHGRLYDFGNDEFRFLYPPFAALVLRPLVWLSRAPGISHLLDAAYQIFARNRLKLTGRCTADRCGIPRSTP